MQRAASVGFALCLLAFAAGATCTRHSPTSPRAFPGPTLSITGSTSLCGAGATSQLRAIMTAAGDTTDVTRQVAWLSPPDGVVQVDASGLLTALAFGRSSVTAVYQGSLQATSPVRVAPDGAFLLTGRVESESGFNLPSARVRAISEVGTFETTAGKTYLLPAAGDSVVFAEHEGFEPLDTKIFVEDDTTLNLELKRPDTPETISGEYEVIFAASPSCAGRLPPEAMERRYQATLDEFGSLLVVTMTSGSFVLLGESQKAGFTGSRNGADVVFTFVGPAFEGYTYRLVERIAGVGDIWHFGSATGQFRERRIRAIYPNHLKVVSPTDISMILASCEAADHVIEFRR